MIFTLTYLLMTVAGGEIPQPRAKPERTGYCVPLATGLFCLLPDGSVCQMLGVPGYTRCVIIKPAIEYKEATL